MSHYLTLKKIGQAVAYYPNLTLKLGSVNASILLSQFIYWHDKTDNPLGVYKTQEDIKTETGLGRKEQETGRKILRELGLITETYKRTEHKLYFLFHPDVFDVWFNDEAMSESDIRECDKVAVPMPESDIPPMSESDIRYIHKNTNENTARENTHAENQNQNQKNGKPLALDIEQIKTRFALAGIIPSTANVLVNTQTITQELYQFNQYYSHLYMTENQAYAKLIAWFKRIKDRGNLGLFFKNQESVPAGAANSFVAPLPIRGVTK